jgi:hypothetical protein
MAKTLRSPRETRVPPAYMLLRSLFLLDSRLRQDPTCKGANLFLTTPRFTFLAQVTLMLSKPLLWRAGAHTPCRVSLVDWIIAYEFIFCRFCRRIGLGSPSNCRMNIFRQNGKDYLERYRSPQFRLTSAIHLGLRTGRSWHCMRGCRQPLRSRRRARNGTSELVCVSILSSHHGDMTNTHTARITSQGPPYHRSGFCGLAQCISLAVDLRQDCVPRRRCTVPGCRASDSLLHYSD